MTVEEDVRIPAIKDMVSCPGPQGPTTNFGDETTLLMPHSWTRGALNWRQGYPEATGPHQAIRFQHAPWLNNWPRWCMEPGNWKMLLTFCPLLFCRKIFEGNWWVCLLFPGFDNEISVSVIAWGGGNTSKRGGKWWGPRFETGTYCIILRYVSLQLLGKRMI